MIEYLQEMWRLAIQAEPQGIWFWASLYALFLCSYSLLFQIRTRFWPFTQGELVEASVEKFGATEWAQSNQEYVGKALYRYTVSDITYDGKRISPWIFVASHNARFILQRQMAMIQRLPDGGIKVYYNPANLPKSYLIVAGKTGILVTILITFLPIVIYFFSYHL